MHIYHYPEYASTRKLTCVVSARCIEDEGRVAFPPVVANASVPVDDKGWNIHSFEPRSDLKTCLSGSNYSAEQKRPISALW